MYHTNDRTSPRFTLKSSWSEIRTAIIAEATRISLAEDADAEHAIGDAILNVWGTAPLPIRDAQFAALYRGLNASLRRA